MRRRYLIRCLMFDIWDRYCMNNLGMEVKGNFISNEEGYSYG